MLRSLKENQPDETIMSPARAGMSCAGGEQEYREGEERRIEEWEAACD